ncbi:hypothetical protein SUGI_0639060 [Cryptomeria japonica]|nr:hypothetical protein SUGI_0639060 [Cryptomeria japonica]
MDQKHKAEESNELQVRVGHSRAKKTYSIAPFTPAENTTRIKTVSSVKAPISIIPKEAKGRKKGASFESQEPTSPKVSCIGQVKLKKKQPRKTQVGHYKGGSEKSFKAQVGNKKGGSEKTLSAKVCKKNGGFEKTFSGQVGNMKGGSEKTFSAQVNNKNGGSEKTFSGQAGNKNGGSENRTKETRGELAKISKLRRLFSVNKMRDHPVKEKPGNNYPSLGEMKRFTSCRESVALANFFHSGI